eukprot:scaffold1392_cov356-Prasinococcus_capsulatus_cf.AAC.3
MPRRLRIPPLTRPRERARVRGGHEKGRAFARAVWLLPQSERAPLLGPSESSPFSPPPMGARPRPPRAGGPRSPGDPLGRAHLHAGPLEASLSGTRRAGTKRCRPMPTLSSPPAPPGRAAGRPVPGEILLEDMSAGGEFPSRRAPCRERFCRASRGWLGLRVPRCHGRDLGSECVVALCCVHRARRALGRGRPPRDLGGWQGCGSPTGRPTAQKVAPHPPPRGMSLPRLLHEEAHEQRSRGEGGDKLRLHCVHAPRLAPSRQPQPQKRAAPRAIAVSGSTPTLSGLSSKRLPTRSRTQAISVEPPTSTTSSTYSQQRAHENHASNSIAAH